MKVLTADITLALFQFPKEMTRAEVEPNRLNNQVLVRYFEQEWKQQIR